MSKKIDVLSLKGEKVKDIKLEDNIFNIEPNDAVVKDAIVAAMAGARQGTASVKTRAEVSGGGRKPWKQKGTGRARQGSTRAPHMVGGGVVHGPKPRNYEKKVNKKVRLLAIKSALSAKVANGNLIVLDDFVLETPKTKTFVEFAKKSEMAASKQLYVVNDSDTDYNLWLSVRNIKDCQIAVSNELTVYELLKYEKVILTKDALANIEEVLA